MNENRLLQLHSRLIDAMCADDKIKQSQIEVEIVFEQEREDWLAQNESRFERTLP